MSITDLWAISFTSTNLLQKLLTSIKSKKSQLLASINLSMPITKYCISIDKFVNINYGLVGNFININKCLFMLMTQIWKMYYYGITFVYINEIANKLVTDIDKLTLLASTSLYMSINVLFCFSVSRQVCRK